jgi:hypothetical protein
MTAAVSVTVTIVMVPRRAGIASHPDADYFRVLVE